MISGDVWELAAQLQNVLEDREILRVLRQRCTVGQTELAAAMGITQAALCQIETGKRPLSAEERDAAFNYLNGKLRSGCERRAADARG